MAANSGVIASSRARESTSSSVSPAARIIVETGTGIAPIRIAARYRTTNAGPSAVNISSRCSGSSPSWRSTAAARWTRSSSWA